MYGQECTDLLLIYLFYINSFDPLLSNFLKKI